MVEQVGGGHTFLRRLRDGAKKSLPPIALTWIRRVKGGPPGQIPIGAVRFGDLRRMSPIDANFGWDRGTAIDRHYIDGFLGGHAADIRGRVLEIGEDLYTRRFGGTRVDRSEILSVESNPKATYVGDLANAGVLPEAVFDCIILTQTLQYVFDTRAALATVFRALKPGGVLLLTVPTVRSQTDGTAWGATWYWWFTTAAIRRLLEESFAPDAVTVKAYGNIFVATAFHYGVALEELRSNELEKSDPMFPVIVTAHAIKQRNG
jgi:SAM-dependent methyltransferase